MLNDREISEQKKVLFTGSGNVVINDLMEHCLENHKMEKCMPTESDFLNALKQFRPHVLVVCLSNEPVTTLHMLEGLKDRPEYDQLPMIAIGNEDDCAVFKKKIFRSNLKIFTRPFDKAKFKTTLEEFLALGIREERREWEKRVAAEKEEREAAARKAAPVAEKAPIPVPTANDGEPRTILVVDDDIIMLNIIKIYLQDLYNVVVVPSGKLALKYLAKKPANLVLLDYMMPGDDGPSVLREIRTNSPNPHIPVVFLTGVADKDLVIKGLELRPNGYLLKPVSKENLLEKVTELLLGL